MSRIDTKRGRDALDPRREPYWHKHARDRHLGFRKLADGRGTWIARYRYANEEDAPKGKNGERVVRPYRHLGEHSDAFGFDAAMAAAIAWFRELDRGVSAKGETVADACKAYVVDRTAQKSFAAGNAAHRMFERTVYGGGGKKGDRYTSHPIAHVRLDKLRRRLVLQWRDGLLTGGLSKSSVNRTLTTLRAALNLAVKLRWVSADQAAEWKGVEPFKNADRSRSLYLDLEQRRALIKAAGGAAKDLIEAAALTGARAGELVSARRSAFDARTKSVTLDGKTGPRTIRLSPKAVELFTRLSESKHPNAFLLTKEDGEPWAHSDWDDRVRAAAKAASLPEGTCLYTLRHSWITQALLEGVSPLEVAKLVGTSLKMIDKTYGHVHDATAAERLAKVQML